MPNYLMVCIVLMQGRVFVRQNTTYYNYNHLELPNTQSICVLL